MCCIVTKWQQAWKWTTLDDYYEDSLLGRATAKLQSLSLALGGRATAKLRRKGQTKENHSRQPSIRMLRIRPCLSGKLDGTHTQR
jgi:hypothetical protein